MDFEFSQRADLRQSQRIVPEQIFAGKLLQMPTMELESFLRLELQDNPALLLDEAEPEPDLALEDDDWEPTTLQDRDEEYDPYRTLADVPSLTDHLKTQFRTQFPQEDWPVGLNIIESLDEDGYFREDLLDAADRHLLSVPEFEATLIKVQTLDPPGIAATDLRSCLAIQAERAENAPVLARRLLEEAHWPHFVKRDAARLADLLDAAAGDVLDAIEWVRENTRPYPAEEYRPEFESLSARKKPLEKPDVIVRLNEGRLWVDVPGLTGTRLGLDPYYESVYKRIRRVRGLALDKDAKHIVDFVDRAKLVAYAIDLRGQTLHRIADQVVQHQSGLILNGPRHAKPYTQKQVAETLGIHESTVCRATAGKLIQLPSGETVPFDFFFDSAIGVRDIVEDIIGHEDRANPLKDGQIADLLEQRGVKIARRTVAKYRDQLHIPACELRKDRAAVR